MSRLAPTESRTVAREDLLAEVTRILAEGWRMSLVAAHEDAVDLRVVYAFTAPGGGRLELTVPVPRDDSWLPTIASASYPGGRWEREIRDLYGIHPAGHPLPFRMVRHDHWPTRWFPMLRDIDPNPTFPPDNDTYKFVRVEGDGVYEIPVGPVHAGLIEPGHFRFSVVGETILRMKARLWFLHRGVEKLFEGRRPEEGIELAERISGDTAVGHTLAYVMAVEDAAGIEVAEGDRVARALLLELERMYNHVNDLGALANDVGYGIANAHLQRLRERLLRHNQHVTGHRLLRGAIGVGSGALLSSPDLDLVRAVADEAAEVVGITLANSVVHDRFTGTAVLDHEQALLLGTLGYVARGSGIDTDARRDHSFVDLGEAFDVVVEKGGDVMARYLVRARELAVSAALVEDLAARLAAPPGERTSVTTHAAGAGLGIVEAWRGALVHRVELDAKGRLSRVKIVDPSFLNWPALPVSLADTIVPDFPLANKSFNQSYAGNDL